MHLQHGHRIGIANPRGPSSDKRESVAVFRVRHFVDNGNELLKQTARLGHTSNTDLSVLSRDVRAYPAQNSHSTGDLWSAKLLVIVSWFFLICLLEGSFARAEVLVAWFVRV